MKFIIYAFAFFLVLGQMAYAQQQLMSLPVEGDHTLLTFDPATQSYSLESLDENNLIATPPSHTPPTHTNPPHTNPPHTNPPHTNPPHTNPPHTNPPHTNPPHTNPPHTNPPHTNPPHPTPHPHPGPHPGPNPHPHPAPGPWHAYPGWHNGWYWGYYYNWHPRWWYVGIVWPAWIWIPVPMGYWQCTAFNSNLQSFSRVGPDLNQAAYGALYACGGPNWQQYGCYIPEGYCQHDY